MLRAEDEEVRTTVLDAGAKAAAAPMVARKAIASFMVVVVVDDCLWICAGLKVVMKMCGCRLLPCCSEPSAFRQKRNTFVIFCGWHKSSGGIFDSLM